MRQAVLSLTVASINLAQPSVAELEWTQVLEGRVTQVAVAPDSRLSVAAAIDGSGQVAVSEDGGGSWTMVEVARDRWVQDLEYEPAGTTLFAVADSLYTSDDRGFSWSAVSALPRGGAEVVALGGPDGPIYAVAQGEVFLSGDRGASWQPLPGHAGGETRDLLAARGCGGVYASSGQGLYRLDLDASGGWMWTQLLPGPAVGRTHCDATGRLMFGVNNHSLLPSSVAIGDGAAAEFRLSAHFPSQRPTPEGRAYPSARLVLSHPHDHRVLYAASHRDGMFVSVDDGQSWTPASDGLPGDPVRPGALAAGLDLAITSRSPYLAYLATEVGLFVSDAAAQDGVNADGPAPTKSVWGLSGPTVEVDGIRLTPSVRSVVVTEGGDVIAGTPGGRVFARRSDGDWSPADDGLPMTGLHQLVAVPGGAVLAAIDGRIGLYRSDDVGRTWGAFNGDELFGPVFCVGVVAADGPRLVAGMRGRLMLSPGAASQWSTVLSHDTEFHRVEVARWDSGTMFAAGRPADLEYGPVRAGLFRSDDSGRAWQSVRADVTDDVVTLAGLPRRVWIRAADSLLVSEDAGDTWTRIGRQLAA